jgi:hypothetical protein
MLAYSLPLNRKAICSSEISVDFTRVTGRYISEERTLLDHRCVKLIFRKLRKVSNLEDIYDAQMYDELWDKSIEF